MQKQPASQAERVGLWSQESCRFGPSLLCSVSESQKEYGRIMSASECRKVDLASCQREEERGGRERGIEGGVEGGGEREACSRRAPADIPAGQSPPPFRFLKALSRTDAIDPPHPTCNFSQVSFSNCRPGGREGGVMVGRVEKRQRELEN